MGYIFLFVLLALLDIVFFAFCYYVFITFFGSYLNRWCPRRIAKLGRFGAHSWSILILLVGYFTIFLIIKPANFNETEFERHSFESFKGFLYDPGFKTGPALTKSIEALFRTLYEHPNKIDYLDLRYIYHESRVNKGYTIVGRNGPDLDNSDFEFYRISYTNNQSLCEKTEIYLRKVIPKYWRHFEGGLSNPIIRNDEKCLYVRKIKPSEASQYEYRPNGIFPTTHFYFPPIFHVFTQPFPVVSPTNRGTLNISDLSDSSEVYISSASNGIMPGTFFYFWGVVLPDSSDIYLIEKILDKYVE